jgi:hypothetical protein
MIFHKYKLIVTGIPKNASTSIHFLLRNPTDHEHNHRSLMDDYHANDSELMDHYQSIAITRNPYDRFISACWQIRRDHPEENWHKDINEIISRELISYPEQHGGWVNDVFIPQHKFICFGKKIFVDTLMSYENLQEDWTKFTLEYNKNATFTISNKLPQYNRSLDRQSWIDELKSISDENLEFINNKYRLDFELFNYPMLDKVPQ